MHFLYLAYYYPPCNSVSGYRPLSQVNGLLKKGHQVTVITRQWHGNEKGWVDYIDSNPEKEKKLEQGLLTVFYLPYEKDEEPTANKLLSKWVFFRKYMRGHFHPELNGYKCFRKKAFELATSQKFDAVIASVPPLNLLRLAYEVGQQHQVPVVVDFRDLWNNDLLIKDKKFTTSVKIKNHFAEKHFRKWTRPETTLVSTVSEKLAEILKEKGHKEVSFFLNGYEDELMAQVQKENYPVFTLSSIGSIYRYYKTDVLVEGINIFLAGKKPGEVMVNFIGATAIPDIAEKLQDSFPAAFVNVTGRVSKNEAIRILKSSHVLLHTAVKEFEGAYTTKIFDYISSGNQVLVAPGDDGGLIDTLIHSTSTGKIAQTPQEVAAYLQDWYQAFKQNGQIPFTGNQQEIAKYSRSHQADKFSRFVLDRLK